MESPVGHEKSRPKGGHWLFPQYRRAYTRHALERNIVSNLLRISARSRMPKQVLGDNFAPS